MQQPIEAIERIRAQGATTPFYFLDVDAIVEHAQTMQAAFRQSFGSSEIAYSYKTNGAECITTALRQAGISAEVVSKEELELALHDGFSPPSIVFDGPMKRLDELVRAIELGVRIQLDSFAEVAQVRQAAELANKAPILSLRGSVRKRRRWSRFGFEPEELLQCAAQLTTHGLPVSGFHFNLGAHQMNPNSYASGLMSWSSELQQLISAWSGDHRFTVDVGGGFPARSVAPGAELRPWSDYAQSVRTALSTIGILDQVHVIAEPGRSLVEDYGYVVYGVTAQKARGRRKLLIADGSGLLTASRNSWFHPVQAVPSGTTKYDIYGCACYERDVIAKSIKAPTAIGERQLIVMGSAGGYDVPSARGWNRPLPAVWVQRGGRFAKERPARVFNELRINTLATAGTAADGPHS